MSIEKLSKAVIDRVLARLSDAGKNGFNQGIVSQAQVYDLPSDFIKLDWSRDSKNFALAQIDSERLEESGIIIYPFACLYSLEAANTNNEKFHQFSGIVRVVFEVTLSWAVRAGLYNFDDYGHCVEDVVVNCINCIENQNWSPVTYNGQIQARRGPVIFGAANWKQKIAFSIFFEYDGRP